MVALDEARDAPRLRLAEVLLRLGRLDEAEGHFRLLLKKNPRHARALLGLARLAWQRGKPQEALVALRQPLNDPWTRKAACLFLVEVEQRLGHPAEAEAARQRAAELPEDLKWTDPQRDLVADFRTGKVALLRRADTLSRQGRSEAALVLLRQAVREYPSAADAWFQLGNEFLRAGKPQAAEPALRRAAELAPNHEHFYCLGNALVAQGNLKDARACFQQAVRLKPDFAPAQYNLGNSLAATGDPAGAETAYRAALRYSPTLFKAHLALARLLADKGQHAEALVHARHARRLKPADEKARQLVERLEKGPGGTPSKP